MDAYTSFAQVYDLFMDNVPYQQWGEFILGVLQENNINQGILLDLGCGTGKMTRFLEKKGYDMIGVDNSFEMLDIAKLKGPKDILYLLQDMTEFELYGTVAAIVSVCDCLNYILDENDLLKVFKLVNNYLDPKGLFIFDINTSYKFKELMGENTFAENRENGSFIWENYYDDEEEINEYDLTLFISQDGVSFKRFQETHYQRNYSLTKIKELLDKSGLEFVKAYDCYTKAEPTEESEKITIIARESGK